jgi:NAD(P)-dependent dehydrogenase (short-subunit alcohol dehydrogenase family)
VLVIDRDLALAEHTVAMIAANGGTAVAHAADLTDENQAKDAVSAALDRFGRLDFLDNNVGIASRGTVVDEKPETWRRLMQVNGPLRIGRRTKSRTDYSGHMPCIAL